MPFLATAFLLSFLLCTLFLQWWQEPVYPLLLWISLGIVGFLGIVGLPIKKNRKPGLLLLALALGTTVALLCVMRVSHTPGPERIEYHSNNKTVLVEGTVTAQPDDRKLKVQYTLTNITLTMSGQRVPLKGNILLIDTQMWEIYQPGDILKAKGKLELPGDEADFSYKNYLAVYGIHALMRSYDIERTEKAPAMHIGRVLWISKRMFEETINSIIPEPQSSLLAGLLTGTRAGMPEEIANNFKTVGLTHIVAISGFNITIIISIIGSLLFFLPLQWRFLPSMLMITLFTLFVGASASVVRASITGILGLFALQTGRLSHARLSLLWTAFFMTVWNPAQLWYDVGFQLSFLAVIGLMELSPILKPLLKKVPAIFGIQEALIATLAAQCTAVPLSLYQFGGLSIVSPLANILVAPLIPLAMLTGFIATILGMVHETAGRITGIATNILLTTIITVADVCAQIPYASIQLTSVSLTVILCYYLLLLIMSIWLQKEVKNDTETRSPLHPNVSAT